MGLRSFKLDPAAFSPEGGASTGTSHDHGADDNRRIDVSRAIPESLQG